MVFYKLLAVLLRVLLSLRYKITIRGLDVININKPSFILPNHQALIDPVILITQMFKCTSVIPVISSDFYDKPILKSFFSNWGAIRVSNLEAGSRNVKVLHEIEQAVIQGFEQNKNVVLYPAGQLSGQGFEKIFNKKSAHHIVKEIPSNVQIIGVRITGLWGSIWSKAWHGKTPDFFVQIMKCLFFIFANLIFFIPRRNVLIEFEDITSQAKKHANESRQSLNTYLEVFYNRKGEEQPLFLKHFFWVKKLTRVMPEKIVGSIGEVVHTVLPVNYDDIQDSVLVIVENIVTEALNCRPEQVKINANLKVDLGVDSLSLVELVSEVENKFSTFKTPQINDIKTVGDLCLVAIGKFTSDSDLKPSYLDRPLSDIYNIKVDNAESILNYFVQTFKTNKNDWFTYDAMLGCTNRKTFFLKACVVAQIIKKRVKGNRVGIMLPALQSATLIIAATYLAGKTPVMLNWTVGKKVLTHCINISGIEIIISAGSFVSKIEDQLPKKIFTKLLLIEKEISNLNIIDRIKGLIISKYTKPFLHKYKPTDTAVILFTSGSETLPKAVPLSHRNILSDLKSVFSAIELNNNNIFLAFLPPFHSFGFTILSVMPMVSGVKVAYTPNPADAREVLKILKHTKANVLLGTPGFLKLMLNAGSEYFFKSVKLIVSGAEAMPESLKKLFEKQTRNALLVEGYGITECSPVLTLNPFQKQKINSVGKFLPGVEFKIIDLVSGEAAKQGNPGMIYVRGENVFKGYLNDDLVSPFEDIDGDIFYKTGDIGYIDLEGYLFITGRLKRFIKIAGEMISLPFIEKILLKQYGEIEPVLAVEGSDKMTPHQIVLFTTKDIDIDEANSYLLENGVAPISKLTKIQKINEIPVLGTGKTDYKVLKKMLDE
ncbi:MAG: AMP-binding protein [Bacteroidales bacterium]|nr:AMP-binding protein [Bacteroidales bacterium]